MYFPFLKLQKRGKHPFSSFPRNHKKCCLIPGRIWLNQVKNCAEVRLHP